MRGALLLCLAAFWCFLLGGQVWRGLVEPVETPSLAPLRQASAERAPERVRLPRAPASRHAVVVERPLFSPTRRPPPAPGAEAAPEAPPSPAPDFRVVGAVSMAGTERALVSVAGAPPVMVSAGEMVEGWLVAAIEGRTVAFESVGRTIVADMDAVEEEASRGDRRAAARRPQRASARRDARERDPAAGETPQGTFIRFTQIDD
jgi:general secretion pathway protein N